MNFADVIHSAAFVHLWIRTAVIMLTPGYGDYYTYMAKVSLMRRGKDKAQAELHDLNFILHSEAQPFGIAMYVFQVVNRVVSVHCPL